ncbi:hypothetical protein K457DRAFT_295212 [Linnemannia elongata AG-77]|uniref:Uncharacterized protein n=1 Tax=Linnemannia elongata AG-77 TaxID=1314771 RepID=A0A197JBT0_9FUNG|nr:hypothetical protein K457DRAFT_295212 [Linnemannia elongata AG-77]
MSWLIRMTGMIQVTQMAKNIVYPSLPTFQCSFFSFGKRDTLSFLPLRLIFFLTILTFFCLVYTSHSLIYPPPPLYSPLTVPSLPLSSSIPAHSPPIISCIRSSLKGFP